MKASTLSTKFSITPILSETLAPPNIETKGRLGLSKTPDIVSTSFLIKNPHYEGSNFVTLTNEACSLWQTPNASLT